MSSICKNLLYRGGVKVLVKQLSILLSYFSDRSIENIAKFLAFLMFYVFRFKRNLVIGNINTALNSVFSRSEQIRIGYKSVVSFILTELEFLAARSGKLSDRVSFIGREHLEKALDEGTGAYILCIHMGSWEAMGSAMTRQIEKTKVVVKKVGGPKTDAYITWLREHNGFQIIKRKKKGDAYIGIKKALESNQIVGFVMDQARPDEPKLPFFGKPAKTNTSLAAIWQKCEAPVIPGYCVRTARGRYEVAFLPELKLQRTEDPKADIIENSHRFNRSVENMIRKCPEQYFWLHNRWK